jgi:hypothetical protein
MVLVFFVAYLLLVLIDLLVTDQPVNKILKIIVTVAALILIIFWRQGVPI